MKQILIVLFAIFYAGCGTGTENTGSNGLSQIVAMSPSNGDMDVAPDSDVIVE